MITVPEQFFSVFELHGRIVEFQKNQMIYSQSDVASSIYLIKKGRIRVFSLSNEGREMNYEVLERGRIFGDSVFMNASLRPVNALSVTDSTVIETSLKELEDCLRSNSDLCFLLLKMTIERSDTLSEMLKYATIYNSYQKVAAFLIRNAKEDNVLQGIHDHTLPYSHQEIADSTFLQRPTVSKILRSFEEQRFIRTRYKKIQLIDAQGLQRKYLDTK